MGFEFPKHAANKQYQEAANGSLPNPNEPDHLEENLPDGIATDIEDKKFVNPTINSLEDIFPPDFIKFLKGIDDQSSIEHTLPGKRGIEYLSDYLTDISRTGKIEESIKYNEIAFLFGIIFQDDQVFPRVKERMIKELITNTNPEIVQNILSNTLETALHNTKKGSFATGVAQLESLRISLATLTSGSPSNEAHAEITNSVITRLKKESEDPDTNYLLALRMRLVANEDISISEDELRSEKYLDTSKDYKPFRISRDCFGLFNKWTGRLHVTNPTDFQSILSAQHNSKEKKPAESSRLETSFYELKPEHLTVNPSTNNNHLENYQSYIMIARERIQKLFQQDFNCNLRRISFPEQNYFLQYLRRETNESARLLQSAAKSYGIDFLRTFLSLEHGGLEMGEKILTIGNNIEHETAHAIFTKYTELVDAAENVETYLRKNYPRKEKFPESDAQEVAEKLLKRGKDLLIKLSEDARSEKIPDTESILSQLDSVRAEVELMRSSFSTLVDNGEISSFSEAMNMDLQISTIGEGPLPINAQDIKTMQRIYQENYPDVPPAFQIKLIESLENALATPGTRFYVLRDSDDNIIGFNRFTPIDTETSYFGAFNIDPKLQRSRLGNILMDESLEKETLKNNIDAHCIPEATISQTYIEERNFVGTAVKDIKDVSLIKIQRDPTLLERLQSRDLQKDIIIQRLNHSESVKDGHLLFRRSSNLPPDLTPIQEGYILTRFFTDKKTKQIYTVFEQTTENHQ